MPKGRPRVPCRTRQVLGRGPIGGARRRRRSSTAALGVKSQGSDGRRSFETTFFLGKHFSSLAARAGNWARHPPILAHWTGDCLELHDLQRVAASKSANRLDPRQSPLAQVQVGDCLAWDGPSGNGPAVPLGRLAHGRVRRSSRVNAIPTPDKAPDRAPEGCRTGRTCFAIAPLRTPAGVCSAVRVVGRCALVRVQGSTLGQHRPQDDELLKIRSWLALCRKQRLGLLLVDLGRTVVRSAETRRVGSCRLTVRIAALETSRSMRPFAGLGASYGNYAQSRCTDRQRALRRRPRLHGECRRAREPTSGQ